MRGRAHWPAFGLCRLAAGFQVAPQALQIALELRCGLAAQLAIFLQRLIDDFLQLEREFGVQLHRRLRPSVEALKAVNCQTGDSLGSSETEAEGRERVIRALSEVGNALRGKLGESLASVQKHDKPLDEATTSSLEALKRLPKELERHASGAINTHFPP